jgi:hypothetical protein
VETNGNTASQLQPPPCHVRLIACSLSSILLGYYSVSRASLSAWLAVCFYLPYLHTSLTPCGTIGKVPTWVVHPPTDPSRRIASRRITLLPLPLSPPRLSLGYCNGIGALHTAADFSKLLEASNWTYLYAPDYILQPLRLSLVFSRQPHHDNDSLHFSSRHWPRILLVLVLYLWALIQLAGQCLQRQPPSVSGDREQTLAPHPQMLPSVCGPPLSLT